MAWLYPAVAREPLAQLLDDLRGRVCGVMGLGVTGTAVAELLLLRGATVLLADERAPGPPALLARGAACAALPLGPESFAACAMVVVSPGVPPFHAALEGARARGAAVVGELELVSLLAPEARIAAITGTNGKSTTTALLGAWLTALGERNFCGGNLGLPMSAYLADEARALCAVLEVSSYHIDGAHHFRPLAAAVLNLAPDHLARYGTMQMYAASKTRLAHAVPERGYVVLNADDSYTRAMARGVAGKVLFFGETAREAGGQGLVIEGESATPFGKLPWHDGDASVAPRSFDLSHPRLFGRHNRHNAAAALLLLGALRPELIAHPELLAAYRSFSGLPHRLAFVAEAHGVTFINDSKATNDAAAAIGIRGVTRPLIVLLGGEDKGGGYREVACALRGADVRAVVCYGAARPQLLAALAAPGDAIGASILSADNLEGALELAVRHAHVGDCILLSPACASFDAFANYIARGEAFVRWVERYALGPAPRPIV